MLNEHMDRFTRIGFEIEPFGGEEYAVRAIPDNLFGIAKERAAAGDAGRIWPMGSATSMTPEHD